jgi:Asp-tRNA(Asn)/Glu-tRNA(Gln) amidotransferase C subunit
MSHVGSSEALRDDAFREGLSGETSLAAAPDPADRLFRVPRILGG